MTTAAPTNLPSVRKPNMSPQEARLAMAKIATMADREQRHIAADVLLCFLLRDLGYTGVIDEYANIERWYA